ncbi:MAG: replication protein [Ruminococcus sp.]|nr:replication protein [Ruminococcus sp.]
MADPQLQNGYTKIANELLEAICRLNISGNEMRILLYIIRRTYGFNRSYAEMPLSEISAAVGIRKNHVSEVLNRLSAKNIIELHSNRGIKPQTISIVKNYEKWAVESCAVLPFLKTGTVPENRNPTIPEIGNPTVPENRNPTIPEIGNPTYKEKKENIKERVKERTPRGDYGNVFLSDDEINKLNQDYGEDNIRTYIQKVDNYVQSKGRPYSDYAATLRSWLDKDGIKKSGFDASKYEFLINNF